MKNRYQRQKKRSHESILHVFEYRNPWNINEICIRVYYSLSRREESYKKKLFAWLLVCPQGQKNIDFSNF